MRQSDRRPIGVFDSGVGGLTVFKSIEQLLPHENMIYLGDTARVPYGTKSADVVIRYSIANAEFLMKQDIKLLVVACNTASAVGLPELSRRLKVPVIGVIEPGAKAAALASRSGRIGVIATPGTIRSGAYQRALESARSGLTVIARACPLFVPIVEEGWVSGEVPRLVAREYLTELARSDVDTLVLGCTHYPLLRMVIAEAMGASVQLIDSAEATARTVERHLGEHRILSDASGDPQHQFFVTDVPERFVDVAARFLGHPISDARQVDLTFG